MRPSFVLVCALALAACSRGGVAARVDPGGPVIDASLATSVGKPFGAFCVEDAECVGAVCFHKRVKGPDAAPERRGADDAVEHDGYCSLRCNDDKDCPVPLTKGRCGARGMCKRPD